MRPMLAQCCQAEAMPAPNRKGPNWRETCLAWERRGWCTNSWEQFRVEMRPDTGSRWGDKVGTSPSTWLLPWIPTARGAGVRFARRPTNAFPSRMLLAGPAEARWLVTWETVA